jgi:hypothetical protein
MSIGSRTEQCGTVLAGVKAKPFGWPSASPDPGCGRRQRARTGSPIPQITSLRFQGIATSVWTDLRSTAFTGRMVSQVRSRGEIANVVCRS